MLAVIKIPNIGDPGYELKLQDFGSGMGSFAPCIGMEIAYDGLNYVIDRLTIEECGKQNVMFVLLARDTHSSSFVTKDMADLAIEHMLVQESDKRYYYGLSEEEEAG